ncbi:MAG TPA: amidohydrolase [Thermoanaerobaculia bacterium]|nr:amidohydrolase [Thermoanaerobaculia bacterium]
MKKLFALLLFFAAFAVHAKTVDIVIRNGTILTMAGPNIAKGGVAIDKGTIVAVGNISGYTGRTTIDATGEAVLPGFINTHTHVPMVLFRGIADDRALMDWLQHFIFPAEAKNVTAEFVKWGTRLGAAEMIESGTTTFTDMYYFEDEVAAEAKRAGLRAVAGETLIDFPAPDNKTWDAAMAYCRSYIKKWQGDPLITPALAPHSPYLVSKEHLIDTRRLANELHAPILIHVSETKAEQKQIAEQHDGLTPAAYLDSIGFLGHDVVAAHGVWLDADDIRIFAEKGVGVAHCPRSNMMLADGIAPVVDMLKGGVNVGIGTDGPAGSGNNLDMLEDTVLAARLQKVAKMDPTALSARKVLEMATIGGAKVLGLDTKIGTLEAGKRADIIIMNLQHVRTQPVYAVESAIVYAATGDDVATTIVDGKVLMRDRKVLTVNVPEAIAKAKQYRDQVEKTLQYHPGS